MSNCFKRINASNNFKPLTDVLKAKPEYIFSNMLFNTGKKLSLGFIQGENSRSDQ